ncbi:hypothetical protein NNL21_14620 [Paenibacillus mendelii]|nr:hypothetical protein [Paenibacillus mendelii]
MAAVAAIRLKEDELSNAATTEDEAPATYIGAICSSATDLTPLKKR